jgi:hypothetical protein
MILSFSIHALHAKLSKRTSRLTVAPSSVSILRSRLSRSNAPTSAWGCQGMPKVQLPSSTCEMCACSCGLLRRRTVNYVSTIKHRHIYSMNIDNASKLNRSLSFLSGFLSLCHIQSYPIPCFSPLLVSGRIRTGLGQGTPNLQQEVVDLLEFASTKLLPPGAEQHDVILNYLYVNEFTYTNILIQ